VGSGKVEIQNQDSHFSTAQNRLRRKEKNGRLHKTLDAPVKRTKKAILNSPLLRQIHQVSLGVF